MPYVTHHDGSRTQIYPDINGLVAQRLDDQTFGAFRNAYVREHITHGYAVTVHSAQGVTADTTHAASASSRLMHIRPYDICRS